MAEPKRLAGLIFPGFELLDLFGPLEMFGVAGMVEAPGYALTLVGETGTPVKSFQGPSAAPDASFADGADYDLILVPGGFGTRSEIDNAALIAWVKEACQKAECVMSVCTGASLLARAGVLDNRSATTNKMVFNEMTKTGPATRWVVEARWVRDGKVWTSSGVSAGMDMALAVIAEAHGEEVAEKVAIGTEYDWHRDANWDPFASIHGLVSQEEGEEG